MSYGMAKVPVVIDNEELHYSKVERSKDGYSQFECGLVIWKDFMHMEHYCKKSKIQSLSLFSSMSSWKFALQIGLSIL